MLNPLYLLNLCPAPLPMSIGAPAPRLVLIAAMSLENRSSRVEQFQRRDLDFNFELLFNIFVSF